MLTMGDVRLARTDEIRVAADRYFTRDLDGGRVAVVDGQTGTVVAVESNAADAAELARWLSGRAEFRS